MRMIDIAAAAGVSASTVSRVIRGRKNISPETAALVRRVMQEMGYRPSPAKSKRDSREQEEIIFLENQVTVLSFEATAGLGSACCLNNLNQLSVALAREGLQMTYLHWPWNHELPTELIEYTDGFILLEGSVPARVSRQLAAKPLISLFCPSAGPGDQILTGYYQVGQLAASHLLQLNIRHMILLFPPTSAGFYHRRGGRI